MTLERHLLPQEFDLLLDEEVGFGIPPLLAHVRECEQCRNELAASRAAIEPLGRLPHIAPSPLFAERVMTQVRVFRPWHAAALDLARRIAPRQGPVRTVVAAMAALVMVTLTGTALWAVTRINSFLFLLEFLADQSRRIALDVVGTLFGAAAVAALEAGGGRVMGLAVIALLLAATVGVAVILTATRVVRARSR